MKEIKCNENIKSGISNSGHPYYFKNYEGDNKDILNIVNYRGKDIAIYIDDPGQQFYCNIDGEEYGFGAFNTNYIDDLCHIIDNKLDIIYRFEGKYFGSRLAWFENDYNRDIGLYYRNRLVKVFPIEADYTLTEESKHNLIEESKAVLDKFIKD